MNSNQLATCHLIAHAVFGEKVNNAEEIDWQAVFAEMMAHTIICLPGDILKYYNIPSALLSLWKQRILAAYYRFSQIKYGQKALSKLLEHNNIRFVIVKGLAAAQYYPVPEYRMLGDVDFIVHPDDFAKAEKLIYENGYTKINDNGRHIELQKDNILFEMHRYFSKTGQEDLDNIIIQEMSNAKCCEVGGVLFPCLPDQVNGLVILQHIRQHFVRNGGLGLRQIIDWMVFADKCLDNDYWPKFKRLADRAGLTQLAITTTRMCQKYLGLSNRITWCLDTDSSTCEEMLEFLFESGNFGCKLNENEDTVTTVSRELRSEGLFKTLQKTGKLRWRLVNRFHWLVPFAWIYGIYFYIKRGFDVGGIPNAIRGYTQGKRFDKLLKKIDLYK